MPNEAGALLQLVAIRLWQQCAVKRWETCYSRFGHGVIMTSEFFSAFAASSILVTVESAVNNLSVCVASHHFSTGVPGGPMHLTWDADVPEAWNTTNCYP